MLAVARQRRTNAYAHTHTHTHTQKHIPELISIAALAEPFPPFLDTDLHQTVTPESNTTPSKPL